MSDFLRIVAVLLLVLGNAIFVAAEYALVMARRTRLADLVRDSDLPERRPRRARPQGDRAAEGRGTRARDGLADLHASARGHAGRLGARGLGQRGGAAVGGPAR